MLAHQLIIISFSKIVFRFQIFMVLFSNIYDLIIINKVQCFIEQDINKKYMMEGEG